MGSTHSKADRRQKHAAFHMGFIWTALAVALGAGFSTGTHLSFVIGLGFPVSQGFASFVQAHGHVQLTGKPMSMSRRLRPACGGS